MEKLDFKEVCKIYYSHKNELLHGGYFGEFLNRQALEHVFNTLNIEDKNIRYNLVCLFSLGEISNK